MVRQVRNTNASFNIVEHNSCYVGRNGYGHTKVVMFVAVQSDSITECKAEERHAFMAAYLMFSISRLQRVVGSLLPHAPVTYALFASCTNSTNSTVKMETDARLRKQHHTDMVPATFISFRDSGSFRGDSDDCWHPGPERRFRRFPWGFKHEYG